MSKEAILNYLKSNGINARDLANLCHISYQSVLRYCAGEPIAFRMAAKLEKYTNGGLTLEELDTQRPREMDREFEPLPDAAAKIFRYCCEKKISREEFCRITGISPSTLYLLIKGKEPTDKICERIERATKGGIKTKDLLLPKSI